MVRPVQNSLPTRGNNVWAYPDRSSNNAPDTDVTIDGGDDLQFDFFYEDFGDLDSILPAATTQLFYMNNALHDMLWHHGFDAPSGNFQQNNYGLGGNGSDPVPRRSPGWFWIKQC